MPDATIKQVRDYFNSDTAPLSLTQFRVEWEHLTEEDRAQLKAGIGNESLTY